MKKSELYHLAQITVVTTPCITPEHKLEILEILFEDKRIAVYTEEKEEKKAAIEE